MSISTLHPALCLLQADAEGMNSEDHILKTVEMGEETRHDYGMSLTMRDIAEWRWCCSRSIMLCSQQLCISAEQRERVRGERRERL